jgi:hypothetical protein
LRNHRYPEDIETQGILHSFELMVDLHKQGVVNFIRTPKVGKAIDEFFTFSPTGKKAAKGLRTFHFRRMANGKCFVEIGKELNYWFMTDDRVHIRIGKCLDYTNLLDGTYYGPDLKMNSATPISGQKIADTRSLLENIFKNS